ncbi:DUF2264 domain-containing protein [Arcicella aurantiaca]|nr:DUF2264 domain-containing protein [Arcicella aurantiaca]
MFRRNFLKGIGLTSILPFSVEAKKEVSVAQTPREFWVEYLQKLAEPLLTNLAKDQLKANMPNEGTKIGVESHAFCNTLEGFGRLIVGISPWLQSDAGSEKEKILREKYLKLTIQGLANATNPQAKDYMPWSTPSQPLVDAAFLALGLMRCPKIWEMADAQLRKNVVASFQLTRNIKPYFSNWLLFSGMIEAFFLNIGEDYDKMRLDFAIRQHEQWYKGDGTFGDGPDFHWDYYNSFVIQPFLYEILRVAVPKHSEYNNFKQKADKIYGRYAIIQERMINPDGSFTAYGRSLGYRAGCFHHLANVSLHQSLPTELSPAQVREALTAVIRKTTEHKDTFDKNGWLRPGLYGFQPSILENYVVTGSSYLCSSVLLPLGLPETDAFWASPAQAWTSQKIWQGAEVSADHALSL